LTDTILSAVLHLAREGGPFGSALTQAGDARSAVARALATIDSDVRGATAPAHGGSGRLEALLQARLLEGLKRGDVPADLDIGDLAAFYTSVAVSLVVEVLGDGAPETLNAIRRVAMRILPEAVLAAP
jgi:hypothetical protein